MVRIDEMNDNLKYNFRTLHHDIGMVKRTNGHWDLWFENGDLVSATELHSLQVGIIIACLTSWNYLNRYGNPTYQVFGNRAYELLKSNKQSMTQFKVQQFFLECLKRMRRVYDVIYLNVNEIPTDPYTYYVDFEVISIDNTIVRGDFIVDSDTNKAISFINFTYSQPYASPYNPLIIDVYLGNEYGGGIGGEMISLVVKGENGDEVMVGGITDGYGHVRIEHIPTSLNHDSTIYFTFAGNSMHNPCVSQELVFQSTPFYFQVDEESDLWVISSLENIEDIVYIGEFVESLSNVPSEETNKLYITRDETGLINAYDWKGELKYENISINGDYEDCMNTIHLFISPDNTELYMYDEDNHVYYIGEGEQKFD